jgi:hypothetical protein
MSDFDLILKGRGSPNIDFDEQWFIDEHLRILQELHGSYNASDEEVVKKMAADARSYAIADSQLLLPHQQIYISPAHGGQPSPWLKIRDNARDGILKCRKDLNLDIAHRRSGKPKEEDNSVDQFMNLRKREHAPNS